VALAQTAPNPDRAIFAAIAGRLCELGDNPLGARHWYTEARGYALLCEDPEVLAEVALYFAASAWARRDVEDMSANLATAESPSSPHLRALCYEIRGAFAISETRYTDALSYFQTGLLLLAAFDEPLDHWLEGNILRQLSALVADLGRGTLTEMVADRYDTFTWSEDQRTARFGCAYNTGVALDAMGYQLRAFKYFRDAAEFAPSMPFQMLIYAVRSRAAQVGGEPLFAQDQLSSALKIYAECNWEAVDAEGRLTLLELAQTLCQSNPALAASVMAKYRSVQPVRSADLIWASDPRLGAREGYATALVSIACGEFAKARALLLEALDVSVRLDQILSASECAIELGALGIRNGAIDAALERAACLYENSWIGRRAQALLQSETAALGT
jgi:tetratricopeptide (TPR) repeat protein